MSNKLINIYSCNQNGHAGGIKIVGSLINLKQLISLRLDL